MKTTMQKLILSGFTIGCLTVSTMGDTIWTGLTDSNFGTAGNWDNGLPGSGATNDLATIGNGDTVNLASDFSGANPYRLTVDGNSTLNVSATATARYLNIGAGSTVNMLPGSNFLMPQVSGANNGGWSINGTLEISGGTAAFNERLFGSGTVRVIGDDAAINWHQMNGNTINFDFEFGAAGVSGIIGGGPGIGGSGAGPYFDLGTSSLSVDGSAYTGGSGSFTLFNSNNLLGTFAAENITVVGFGDENTGWTLTQNLDTDDIILNVVIPEPSTLALLGAGGVLLWIARMRRFRAHAA